jgi:hypothetical protein
MSSKEIRIERDVNTLEGKRSAALTHLCQYDCHVASTLFVETPLHEWKNYVFNTSTKRPSEANVTQETRAVTRYTHVESHSVTGDSVNAGVKAKYCVLYYVAVCSAVAFLMRSSH